MCLCRAAIYSELRCDGWEGLAEQLFYSELWWWDGGE
jgi:hypothetical protein